MDVLNTNKYVFWTSDPPIKCLTVVPPVEALPLSPSINTHVKQIDIDDSEDLRIN